MMKWEAKLQKWLMDHILMLAYVAILLIGLFIRFTYFPFLSEDLKQYNVPWLNLMRESGIAGVFQDRVFFNYSPLHLYLWTLVAKCTGSMDALAVLKAVGLVFDGLLCFACWHTVCMLVGNDGNGTRKLIAFALLWLHPILVWNNAAWGQTDVIYGLFAVSSLLLLMRNRPVWAILCYAVAFALKMQALFLFPLFLFVYFCNEKKFSFLWFLALPAVLISSGIPLVLVDQSPLYGITNYMGQIDTYSYMTYNYPNLFAIVGDIHANSQMVVGMHSRFGMVLCLVVLGCMLVFCVRKRAVMDPRRILQLAVWSIWCCVFLLPRMHERYGFVGEMLLACWVLVSGRKRDILCLLLNALAILSAYASYLYLAEFFSLTIGGLMNFAALGIFTWSMLRDLNTNSLTVDETFTLTCEGDGAIHQGGKS